MTDRWIVASSGGFVGTGLWGVMRPGRIFHRALELSGKERPRVLLILTASGDDPQYLSAMYSALADEACDVDHLALFPQPNRPVDDAIEEGLPIEESDEYDTVAGWLMGTRSAEGESDAAPRELPPGSSAVAGLIAQAPHLDSPEASVSPIPELGDEVFSAALDFNLTRVGAFMVPRTEIVAMPLSSAVDELKRRFVETKLSRIVVYRDTLDELVGIVHSSALLEAEAPPTALEPLIQPLLAVPETLPANQLLREFNRHRKSIAAVVDEFGGTAGLVTLEDLVEVIVGEIDDEYDEPKDPDRVEEPLGPDAWRLSARLEIEYLNRTYALELPEGEYTTLGGYVLQLAERIPEVGESFVAEGLRLTVLSATPSRVAVVKVERLAS